MGLRLGPGARPTRVPQGESDEAGMGSGLLALSTWPEFPDVKQRSSLSQVHPPVMGGMVRPEERKRMTEWMEAPDFLLKGRLLNILGLAIQEAKSGYYVRTYLFILNATI